MRVIMETHKVRFLIIKVGKNSFFRLIIAVQILIQIKVKRKTIVFTKDRRIAIKTSVIIKQTEWKVEKVS